MESTHPALPTSQIVDPAQTVWGSPLQPAGCPACRQAHLVAPARLGQPCPSCARGPLTAQPARLRPEPPELVIPFRKTRPELRPLLERFAKDVWLRPADFDAEQMLKRVVPVYWPMWLVDSDLAGHWQAEVGFDYQVKSSQESFAGGGWTTREVVETRVRWEPRAGQLERHYDNVAAPALSEHQKLISLAGDYQRDQAMAYAPAQMREAAVRVPDLPPESAWPLAQTQLTQAAGEECRQAAAAQHVRNFALQADYGNLHWTQLLHPLYATYYTDDDGKRQAILINGQSGVIGGVRLASQRKGWQWAGIFLGVAAGLFLLALLIAAVGLIFPPLIVLGILLGVLALGVACGAIVPAAWPWQWNRRQTHDNAK